MMINELVGCNVCDEGYTLPYHDILTEYIWFVVCVYERSILEKISGTMWNSTMMIKRRWGDSVYRWWKADFVMIAM